MLTTLKNWWHQEEVCTQTPELELAVTKLMVGMMAMDGKIDSNEQMEIAHLLHSRFGFSEEECNALVIQAMDESRSDLTYTKVVKHIVDTYSMEEREAILAQVWRVALADDKVDFVEERYMNRLSVLLGVSSQSLKTLKQDQEKHISELDESDRFQNPNLQN